MRTALCAMVAVAVGSTTASEPLLRRMVGEVALDQVTQQSPAWHPDQRDCAGLVRFAYRSAFKKLDPRRLEGGLFEDPKGKRVDFADAETLLRGSFALLGRDDEARQKLQSGDLVAFRREDGAEGDAVWHLMLVVKNRDPAKGDALVVYHPGEKGAAVRAGTLGALSSDAPREWRPVPENPAFLGFFRFKEWIR